MNDYPYYYTLIDANGHRIRLRDDGYRIHFQLLDAGILYAQNVDPNEWILWAEYKQCDLPGPARRIADVLMGRCPR